MCYDAGINSPRSAALPPAEVSMQLAIFGFALLLIFFGDRTPLFLRATKLYDPVHFAVACLLALAVGFATLKKSEKGDLGFLNREQTDEWKGWMQVAILIYHYLGASKIVRLFQLSVPGLIMSAERHLQSHSCSRSCISIHERLRSFL